MRQAGASFVEDAGWLIPDHFGDPAAEYHEARKGGVVFDQSHRGKLELTGSEASSFLHNLCTNDVNNLALGAGCEAFLTTKNAKIVSHLFIYHVRLHDGRRALWLDVPPGTSEKVIQYLDHFVISEQVEFADRTHEFAQFYVAGPNATQVLEGACSTMCRRWTNCSTWSARLAPTQQAIFAGTTCSVCRATTLCV